MDHRPMGDAHFVIPAIVQAWNDREVEVQCPYCGDCHRHGFDGNYDDIHRTAFCMVDTRSRNVSTS
jgi:hypothetical protein